MLLLSRAVRRGTTRALVVADMPFLTYQVSAEEALRNAARLVREGGAAAVKLEGGRPVADAVRRLTASTPARNISSVKPFSEEVDVNPSFKCSLLAIGPISKPARIFRGNC